MPTASDSATNPRSPSGATSAEGSVEDASDDLGDRLHAMSKCSPADAEQILDLLKNPQPLDERAKAVHEAGLARFAARFRIVESR